MTTWISHDLTLDATSEAMRSFGPHRRTSKAMTLQLATGTMSSINLSNSLTVKLYDDYDYPEGLFRASNVLSLEFGCSPLWDVAVPGRGTVPSMSGTNGSRLPTAVVRQGLLSTPGRHRTGRETATSHLDGSKHPASACKPNHSQAK